MSAPADWSASSRLPGKSKTLERARRALQQRLQKPTQTRQSGEALGADAQAGVTNMENGQSNLGSGSAGRNAGVRSSGQSGLD